MQTRRSSRFIPWVLGIAVAGSLFGLCCVRDGRGGPEANSAAEVSPQAGAGESRSLEAMPPAVDEAERIAPEDLKAAAEPGPLENEDAENDKGAALNPVAHFMRNSDQHDRKLLSAVERETQKAPSPEVMELLAQRRAGASREQIERFIDNELGADLRVRVAAKRWLRESMGGAAPEASPLPGDAQNPGKVPVPSPR